MNKLLAFLSFIVLISSCVTEDEGKITSTEKDNKGTTISRLKYATCFEITELNNIKKLIIKNPFEDFKTEQIFILLKKGQKYKPKVNETILHIPLKKIIPFSTSYLSMIDTLGELNSIVAIENENYIYNQQLLERVNTKKVKAIGSIEQLNLETILTTSPDALITIGSPGQTAKQIQKIASSGIPYINNYDWQESHPLGKAEWVKFFGALYDKEEEANNIFNFIAKNYNELKKQNKTQQPSVLFSSLYNGVWYIPGGQSYASQFVKDAGGTYPWNNDTTKGSLALSFETIVNKQTEPNIWLTPNYVSLESMKSDDNRYLPFINSVKGRIYLQDKKSTPFLGNDYWEKGALRADLVLKDYIELFKLEGCNDDSLYFFQKIKQ